MSEHFVGLNCTNCGAKLDVYDDMARFACGYCGTEMIVQRRGGTISLKGVAEAIKKVQVGTDKTAAELALVRLNEELKALTEESVKLKAGTSSTSRGCSVMFAATAGSFGLLFFISDLQKPGFVAMVGLVLLAVSILWLIRAFSSTPAERLATLDQQIAETRRRIQEQHEIVNS